MDFSDFLIILIYALPVLGIIAAECFITALIKYKKTASDDPQRPKRRKLVKILGISAGALLLIAFVVPVAFNSGAVGWGWWWLLVQVPIAWDVFTLILFLTTDKASPKRKKRMILTIVSWIVTGTLILAFIVLVGLMLEGIMFYM